MLSAILCLHGLFILGGRQPMDLTRREMIRRSTAAVAAMTLFNVDSGRAADSSRGRDRLGELLPQRPLGRTGERVTMLGVGGAHVGGMRVETDDDARRVIDTALEGGVRFFETAEAYGRGDSERRLGRLLTPSYRDVVFLATKSGAKDAESARRDLDGSLKRLNTDTLDLWQMHCLISPDDVDGRLDQAVLDVMLEAREAGKVRYIGFTGHHDPAAHERMLDRTDAFDTVLMPINVLDPSYESFITRVLPRVRELGMGVQAMKTLAAGALTRPVSDRRPNRKPLVPEHLSLAEALHFVWSLPVDVVVTGVDGVDQMSENIALARDYRPLNEPARQRLIDKVAEFAGRTYEGYKHAV